MNFKPTLRGIGSVLNATLVERLRTRAIAKLIARFEARRRTQRDYAVPRPRIDDPDQQR